MAGDRLRRLAIPLSRHHPVEGSDLRHAIREVARYRGATLAPLRVLLGGVIEFADPAIVGTANGRTWNPGTKEWPR